MDLGRDKVFYVNIVLEFLLFKVWSPDPHYLYASPLRSLIE
jgi:hypothetical protein